MQTKKGQVFSADVVISLIIFMFLVTVCFYLWERTYDRSSYFTEQSVMNERLFQITDLMVRTSGYPSNWTKENVRIIGLANEDHIIQMNKLNETLNMSNSYLRNKLRIRDYNFLLNLSIGNNTYTKGELWDTNATSIMVQARAVLLNDSNNLDRGVLRLYLWK